MNKVIAGAVAGLALGAFSAVSAVDKSAGGGAFFASDFGGGLAGFTAEAAGNKMSLTIPWSGLGINGFFDATYAELGLGLTFGGGKPQGTLNGNTVKGNQSVSFTSLNIGALGKYPVALDDKISLWPAFGIDYALVLSAKSGGSVADDPGEFSALWVKFGAGMDYVLNDAMFLRAKLLYGIRFANKAENDADDAPASNSKPALGHGLSIGVGVGHNF